MIPIYSMFKSIQDSGSTSTWFSWSHARSSHRKSCVFLLSISVYVFSQLLMNLSCEVWHHIPRLRTIHNEAWRWFENIPYLDHIWSCHVFGVLIEVAFLQLKCQSHMVTLLPLVVQPLGNHQPVSWLLFTQPAQLCFQSRFRFAVLGCGTCG